MAEAGDGKWLLRSLEGCRKVPGMGGMGVADAGCRELPEDGGNRVDGGERFRAVVFLQEVTKMGERGGLSRVDVGC